MLWLLACAAPDADTLLHQGDAAGAAAAWEKQGGAPLDLRHPAFDALIRRAKADPTLTMASVAATMGAITLLDGAPDHYLKSVDIPVDALTPLATCTRGWLTSPWIVAAGRSVVPADKEPIEGGALPWQRGRYIGAAHDEAELAALYAALDKDPPPRLTTIALRGTGADLFLFFGRRNGAWLLMSATDGEAAARYVQACSSPSSPAG